MTRTTALVALLGTVALMGTTAPTLAEQLKFTATMSGAAETPANDSPGTGTVDATLDTDTGDLTWSITYAGLSGPATAAHFHGPAAVGEKAAPVVPIQGDLASPIKGSADLSTAQQADLQDGKWYFNVHTAKYPDGEIRGQLTQDGASTDMSGSSSDASEDSVPTS